MEGPRCATCRPHHFHLSAVNPAGCLPCFCMGIVQHCASTSYSRDTVSPCPHGSPRSPSIPRPLTCPAPQVRTPFGPGSWQGFALVNRQRSTRVATGFSVEMGAAGPRLTYRRFGELSPESYYWQLPQPYQGDKVTAGTQGCPLLGAPLETPSSMGTPGCSPHYG